MGIAKSSVWYFFILYELHSGNNYQHYYFWIAYMS